MKLSYWAKIISILFFLTLPVTPVHGKSYWVEQDGEIFGTGLRIGVTSSSFPIHIEKTIISPPDPIHNIYSVMNVTPTVANSARNENMKLVMTYNGSADIWSLRAIFPEITTNASSSGIISHIRGGRSCTHT